MCNTRCKIAFQMSKKQKIYYILRVILLAINNSSDITNLVQPKLFYSTALLLTLVIMSSFLNQDSFDQVKVEPTPVLALSNLLRNLYMFLDIREFRVENLKTIKKKIVLILWCQICSKMALIVSKLLRKILIF